MQTQSFEDSKNVVDPEEVMREIGYIGKYQIVHFLLILLAAAYTCMYNANFIFITADPDNYRCLIPECETGGVFDLNPSWLPEGFDNKCFRSKIYNTSTLLSGESCTKDSFSTELQKCDAWLFETQDTFVANLKLGCSPLKRSLVGTMHYAGIIISMPVMGIISDRFGRKVSLMISTVGGSIIGLSKMLITDYSLYLFIELLESSIATATFTSAFVMLVEIGGIQNRYKIASIGGFFGVFGEVLFGLMASQVKNYKYLIALIYIPCLFCLSFYFLIGESIRWLLATGRKERARDTILKAARWNNKELSSELKQKLNNIEKLKLTDENAVSQNVPLKRIFTSKPILIRLFIAMFWWFSSDLIYYGVLVSSVSLPGNEYENFIYVSLMAIPGHIMVFLILNRFGRRFTLILSFLVCGVAIVAKAFVPPDLPWLIMTLFLIGKMFISAGYSTVYTYASELFPTQVRSFLVGISSMFAGVGSIVAPMTPLLATIMPQLPSFIFGGLALISGFLAIFTPETLNKQLPDTIEDLEKK